MRAFGFYADIGSQGTGSNRTFGGRTGNFTDNDYNWMAGTRIGYTFETDASRSADTASTRAPAASTVATNARASTTSTRTVTHSAPPSTARSISASQCSTYRLVSISTPTAETMPSRTASSSTTDSSASREVRPVARRRPKSGLAPVGVHRAGAREPSARQARKSGTQVIHGGMGWDFDEMIGSTSTPGTSSTTTDTNFDVAEPTRSHRRATCRPAIPRGARGAGALRPPPRHGIRRVLSYSPNDVLTVYALGTLFIPGDFYEIEIDEIAGDQLGAPNSDPDELRNSGAWWAARR